MQEILLKIGLSLFFFRIQYLLMDKIVKNKKAMELVTSRSSGYKASSEKLVMYYLTDEV